MNDGISRDLSSLHYVSVDSDTAGAGTGARCIIGKGGHQTCLSECACPPRLPTPARDEVEG